MSHKSTIRLITDIGANHDNKVKAWRDQLIDKISTEQVRSIAFALILCL